MKLFLSGPMSGYPAFNFPAFHAAAAALRAKGYTVLNPAELVGDPPPLGTERPWQYYMKESIKLLCDHDCNMIYMLPGWSQSRGAKIEFDLAMALGMAWLHDPLETMKGNENE